jgi:putative aldouronate transport system permease protein
VLSTYVYRIGLLGQDFGYGTAVNLFNSIVSVIILLLANLFSKKVLQESLW